MYYVYRTNLHYTKDHVLYVVKTLAEAHERLEKAYTECDELCTLMITDNDDNILAFCPSKKYIHVIDEQNSRPSPRKARKHYKCHIHTKV